MSRYVVYVYTIWNVKVKPSHTESYDYSTLLYKNVCIQLSTVFSSSSPSSGVWRNKYVYLVYSL